MKNHFFKYLWILLVGLPFLTFSNCSKVKFDQKTQPASLVQEEDEEVGENMGDPQDPKEVLSNCNSASNKGSLKTFAQTLVFEDTKTETGLNQVCSFGTGENLSMLENRMRARYEQSYKLNLPKNAVLCDMSMETQLQSFKYDDVFFFTFNNRLLASNHKTSVKSALSYEPIVIDSGNAILPLYNYNWLKLRDLSFQNVADDYCLGEEEGYASCSWPITEQLGKIKFDFDPEILIHLGLKANAGAQKFQFAITGDNDPNVDCYHERLEFDVQVKYYLK